MKKLNGLCPLCGGKRERGRTTFTADLGVSIVVVRDVPARVCVQCGSDWIEDKIAAQIEEIVQKAKASGNQVAVSSFMKKAS